MGDLGSIPGLGRSPGEGKGYPLQYSGLENSMDYTVHGVTMIQTQMSNFHFKLCLDEKRPIATVTGSLGARGSHLEGFESVKAQRRRS